MRNPGAWSFAGRGLELMGHLLILQIESVPDFICCKAKEITPKIVIYQPLL